MKIQEVFIVSRSKWTPLIMLFLSLSFCFSAGCDNASEPEEENEMYGSDENIEDGPTSTVDNVQVADEEEAIQNSRRVRATPRSSPIPVAANGNESVHEVVIGQIADNIPSQMEVGEKYEVEIVVIQGLNDSILFEGLNKVDFTKSIVDINSRVSLALIDPEQNNFQITSLSSERQYVGRNNRTTWEWTVVPLHKGEHELKIRASIELIVDGQGIPQDKVVFKKSVVIKSTTRKTILGLLNNNWQWVLSSLLLPVIIWVVNRFWKKVK